jgi:hypoxanthine phosphoribosyltransferase
MSAYLPTNTTVVSIKVQRPSTAVKHHLQLARLLSRLPRGLTDQLRWVEVEWREATHRLAGRRTDERVQSDLVVANLPTVVGAAHILVVDDTVDSGDTLRHACAVVRKRYQTAAITTAVIASTWRDPPVAPDICLYPRTLIRFPWSMDAAG